jgi:hypothetical protein
MMQLTLIEEPLPRPRKTNPDVVRAVWAMRRQNRIAKTIAIELGYSTDLKNLPTPQWCDVWNTFHQRQGKPTGEIIRSQTIAVPERPRRTWSDEAKFRNRKRRLANRIKKRFSIKQLFDDAYFSEIAKKPEYYGEKSVFPIEDLSKLDPAKEQNDGSNI